MAEEAIDIDTTLCGIRTPEPDPELRTRRRPPPEPDDIDFELRKLLFFCSLPRFFNKYDNLVSK